MSVFSDRLTQLKADIGEGTITARCVVNQAYAQNQHENTSFNHPHGGGPFYLSRPLLAGVGELMGIIAHSVLTTSGTDIESGVAEVAEEMAGYVNDNAPVLMGELRGSGHPMAERNGSVYWERPPLYPRRPEGMPHE